MIRVIRVISVISVIRVIIVIRGLLFVTSNVTSKTVLQLNSHRITNHPEIRVLNSESTDTSEKSFQFAKTRAVFPA